MVTSQSSAGHLLHLIRSGKANTRAALQQLTGLSRSTVGHRLDQLTGAGWIHEAGWQASTGGRPSTRLEFAHRHALVLTADLEISHFQIALTDLQGNIVAERVDRQLLADGPEATLDHLAVRFAALLRDTETPLEKICGIGLAVPGPVDWETGRVVLPPIMPGWDGYPIAERLRQSLAAHAGALSLEVPVLVDNDAHLMAYGEQRQHHPDSGAFVLVKVSTGIGAGVIIDGRVYRGTDGGAGDIGHIRLHDRPDALCMCGSHGCLGAVASGRAVAAQLSELGLTAESSGDVRTLLAKGQPDALRLSRLAGRRCGEVLVTVITLLNPGVLVLAGDLAEDQFLTGVRELLYQRALPRSTRGLQVVTSRLGDRAGLVGAGLTVVEHLYAPDRADARLRDSA
ncbi:ROK family protein [Streptomyces sp. NPDC008150]|uniref:ROK family protein n=1 Tax=Streptomyces sp. NPDC008150 TaxID=3364816 RepID=UPI0036E9A7F4